MTTLPPPLPPPPPSLRERIAAWLADHPGPHSGSDIFAGLKQVDPDTHPARSLVYNELGRMARSGELSRERRPGSATDRTRTFYALTDSQ